MGKKCSKCGIEKDYSEFYIVSCTKDGFRPECKSCKKEYNKKRAEQNKGKIVKQSKRCTKCGIVKDWTEFHKQSASKDGLQPKCKSCFKKYGGRIIKEPKECTQCGTVKDWTEFHRKSASKDGLYAQCKLCRNSNQKNWNKNNPEYSKNYYHEHKEKRAEYQQIWLLNNPEYQQNWERKHRKERNQIKKLKRQEDINFKIASNLRARLNKAIKNNQKVGSAVDDLGCSIGEFKLYIEHQFEDGMTWENYGEWHLDHVIPLNSFDLTNRMEFLEACNWLNIRPLWAKDNLSKGARI